MTTKHLDIGCGANPRNPFHCEQLYGVDIIAQQTQDFHYKQCNVIFQPLPFEDSSFDSVSAYDFLEHIPRTTTINNQGVFPFIHVMNEVYRVLKPGGTFYAITPGYPRVEAFVDPTHVNFITQQTYTYFTAPGHKARIYGFTGKFQIERKVQWIKPSQELKKSSVLIKAIKNLFYMLLFKKKTHLLWQFSAIKDE